MNINKWATLVLVLVVGLATTSCTYPTKRPIQEKWSSERSMQTARKEFAAVEVNGAIYAIAGNTSVWDPTSSVERYFPESVLPWASFEFVEPLPIRKGLRNHAAVSYRGEIYVFGGQLTDVESGALSDEAVTNRVFIYNPQKNTWREGSPMREARANHAAVAYGNLIYVIGGNNGKQKFEPGFEGKRIEVYRPAGDAFVSCFNRARQREEDCASLPENMGETRAALFGLDIYVMEASAGQTVWSFMPFTNHWVRHGDAPHVVKVVVDQETDEEREEKYFRSGYSVTTMNNLIYAVGRTNLSGYWPSNQSFDFFSRSWTNRCDMPTWSNNLAVINHVDKIYTLGGSGGGTTVLKDVYVYQLGSE